MACHSSSFIRGNQSALGGQSPPTWSAITELFPASRVRQPAETQAQRTPRSCQLFTSLGGELMAHCTAPNRPRHPGTAAKSELRCQVNQLEASQMEEYYFHTELRKSSISMSCMISWFCTSKPKLKELRKLSTNCLISGNPVLGESSGDRCDFSRRK